jgi:hypothetical protein
MNRSNQLLIYPNNNFLEKENTNAINKKISWACNTYGDMKNGKRKLSTSPKKRPLGRLKRRFEDNIKMDLKGTGRESESY